jgi:hypothetical protein
VANVILALSAVQILIVNRTLLPPELRPALWRQGLLLACGLFYTFVTACVVRDQAQKFDWSAIKAWFGAA